METTQSFVANSGTGRGNLYNFICTPFIMAFGRSIARFAGHYRQDVAPALKKVFFFIYFSVAMLQLLFSSVVEEVLLH